MAGSSPTDKLADSLLFYQSIFSSIPLISSGIPFPNWIVLDKNQIYLVTNLYRYSPILMSVYKNL